METATAQTTDRQAPASEGRAPARDPWFDSARFILLVFVVIDHLSWRLLPSSNALDTLFYWLHFFHMPAFVVITGYLSRSLVVNDSRARGLVSRLVVPYLIFQTLYQEVDSLIYHHTLVRWAPLDPDWLMWYLMAMIVWRLATPYLMRVRGILIISVVVSLLSGAIGGMTHVLSLDRVLSFLPFYVLGLVLERRHFEMLRTARVRIVSGIVLVLAWPLASTMAASKMDIHWLWWTESYATMGSGVIEGCARRLALLALSTVVSAAVLSFVPTGRNVLSTLGRYTLYGYLLHGFVARTLNVTGAIYWFGTPTGIILFLVGCVALTALLCSPSTAKLLKPLVEPPVEWLLRNRDGGILR